MIIPFLYTRKVIKVDNIDVRNSRRILTNSSDDIKDNRYKIRFIPKYFKNLLIVNAKLIEAYDNNRIEMTMRFRIAFILAHNLFLLPFFVGTIYLILGNGITALFEPNNRFLIMPVLLWVVGVIGFRYAVNEFTVKIKDGLS